MLTNWKVVLRFGRLSPTFEHCLLESVHAFAWSHWLGKSTPEHISLPMACYGRSSPDCFEISALANIPQA